jgi:hypothetical protein
LAPIVSAKVATIQISRVTQLQKFVMGQVQVQVSPQKEVAIPTRRKEEDRLKQMMKRSNLSRQILFGKTEYLLPIKGVKSAAQYIFSRRKA